MSSDPEKPGWSQRPGEHADFVPRARYEQAKMGQRQMRAEIEQLRAELDRQTAKRDR